MFFQGGYGKNFRKKFSKFSEILDFRQAGLEADQMQVVSLCVSAIDTRNNLAILHDLMQKHMEKIKNPRGATDHSAMMY